MKKKQISFYCIILMLFCQYIGGFPGVNAISEEQKTAIVSRCDTIKEDLKIVQHSDSRARVYLGRYYETILNKFITPLNVRLVENNLFNSDLMNNQNVFTDKRAEFMEDFISYQKTLDELVAVDCKNEPEKFYETLMSARKKRKTVAEDVKKLNSLANKQIGLVKILKGKL